MIDIKGSLNMAEQLKEAIRILKNSKNDTIFPAVIALLIKNLSKIYIFEICKLTNSENLSEILPKIRSYDEKDIEYKSVFMNFEEFTIEISKLSEKELLESEIDLEWLYAGLDAVQGVGGFIEAIKKGEIKI